MCELGLDSCKRTVLESRIEEWDGGDIQQQWLPSAARWKLEAPLAAAQLHVIAGKKEPSI